VRDVGPAPLSTPTLRKESRTSPGEVMPHGLLVALATLMMGPSGGGRSDSIDTGVEDHRRND
jgi:hypothetical protein